MLLYVYRARRFWSLAAGPFLPAGRCNVLVAAIDDRDKAAAEVAADTLPLHGRFVAPAVAPAAFRVEIDDKAGLLTHLTWRFRRRVGLPSPIATHAEQHQSSLSTHWASIGSAFLLQLVLDRLHHDPAARPAARVCLMGPVGSRVPLKIGVLAVVEAVLAWLDSLFALWGDRYPVFHCRVPMQVAVLDDVAHS
jgi:hypothetical protein